MVFVCLHLMRQRDLLTTKNILMQSLSNVANPLKCRLGRYEESQLYGLYENTKYERKTSSLLLPKLQNRHSFCK